jgi:hypothetical protein
LKLEIKEEWPVENMVPPKQWIITELRTETELANVRYDLSTLSWGGIPIASYLRTFLPDKLESLIHYHQMKAQNRLIIIVLHEATGAFGGFAIFALGQPHPQLTDEKATVLICWKASEPLAEERLLKTVAILHEEFKEINPNEKSIVFTTKDSQALARFKSVVGATTIAAIGEART